MQLKSSFGDKNLPESSTKGHCNFHGASKRSILKEDPLFHGLFCPIRTGEDRKEASGRDARN